MANSPVKTKIPTTREAFADMVAKIDRAFEQIRDRAFARFQERGGQPGHELDDWFQAERELFVSSDAEMRDSGAAFELQLTAAGFVPEQLEVLVTPEMIVVEGYARMHGERGEVSERRLMRQFTLPAPVDPERVKAHFTDGVLAITASKKTSGALAAAAAT